MAERYWLYRNEHGVVEVDEKPSDDDTFLDLGGYLLRYRSDGTQCGWGVEKEPKA